MKRKLVTTTIAASLVIGSIAGLPLSPQGVNDKLGLSGVAYANTIVDSGIAAKLNAIYAQLSVNEKQLVSAARDNLKGATDTALTAEIWAKVNAKVGNSTAYPALTEASILKLFKDIAFIYDDSYSSLQGAIADPANRAALGSLAKLAGVQLSSNDTADALAFINAVEAQFKQYFQQNLMNLIRLINPLTGEIDIVESKKVLADVLNAVIQQNNKISQVLLGLGIDGATLVKAYEKINNAVDPDNKAQKAIISAYVRTSTSVSYTQDPPDWKKKAISLTLWGHTVPSEAISYSITGQNLTTAGNKIVLGSSVNTTTTSTFELKAFVLGQLVYSGAGSVTFTAPTITPVDPTPDPTPTPIPVPQPQPQPEVKGPDPVKAEEQLAEVAKKLGDLLADNKGDGLAKAKGAIENAIREAAKVDLASTVKVEGGVAKPTIDTKQLTEVFKNVSEIAKSAKEKLAQAAPDAPAPKVVATLELGTVNTKATEIALPKELIAAAKDNGVDVIAVVVSGVSLAIELSQLGDNTSISIRSSESTKTNAVSDEYDLSFSTPTGEIKTFDAPVEVKLPVKDVTGKDTDLLVFAKVEEDGTLTPKGGKYNPDTKEFVAKNKSFSKYVIVENKVEFKDVAAVKEWAGRQIQVVAAKGIVDGREQGQYVPGESVTRAEFVKMLVKTFGLEDAKATEKFDDVVDTDWFKPYVASAVKAGLVEGRSDTSFEPNATITRAEMATMAARALTKVLQFNAVAKPDAALQSFVDAAGIHATLKSGVALATEQGIVIGEEGKQFNPNNDSTRAQAAVVIYRLLNK